LILKSLLEATRKLERQFEQRGSDLHAVVFVRNDIYQHLLLDPADRGKETAVELDWGDPELFKEIIRRRIIQSTGSDLPFEQLWAIFFPTHVGSEIAFEYMLRRTLMRPREILRFAREAIDVAINRRHDKVMEDDITFAEKAYSEDALVDMVFDFADVKPEYGNVPYAFIGAPVTMSRGELERRVADARVPAEEVGAIIELLLWFGFIGLYIGEDDERFSYQFNYNIARMHAGVGAHSYTIHPAFRRVLGVKV
jgi:hypothetical protein